MEEAKDGNPKNATAETNIQKRYKLRNPWFFIRLPPDLVLCERSIKGSRVIFIPRAALFKQRDLKNSICPIFTPSDSHYFQSEGHFDISDRLFLPCQGSIAPVVIGPEVSVILEMLFLLKDGI